VLCCDQFIIIWGAIAMVVLLVCLFAMQFARELHLYGRLLAQDPDQAKDSFFFSLTGTIRLDYRSERRQNQSDACHEASTDSHPVCKDSAVVLLPDRRFDRVRARPATQRDPEYAHHHRHPYRLALPPGLHPPPPGLLL
jgi:hypothetical protein